METSTTTKADLATTRPILQSGTLWYEQVQVLNIVTANNGPADDVTRARGSAAASGGAFEASAQEPKRISKK